MTQRRVDVPSNRRQVRHRVGRPVKLEDRPAVVPDVAQRPDPARPVNHALPDRREPLDLRLVDPVVDLDVARGRASRVLPVRQANAVAVPPGDLDRVGACDRELGRVRAEADVVRVGQQHE